MLNAYTFHFVKIIFIAFPSIIEYNLQEKYRITRKREFKHITQ